MTMNLTPEVVKQIEEDAEDHCDDTDNYDGFVVGAIHQHPIAFEAGKKEGWNEAIASAKTALLVAGFEPWEGIALKLDKLKK